MRDRDSSGSASLSSRLYAVPVVFTAFNAALSAEVALMATFALVILMARL